MLKGPPCTGPPDVSLEPMFSSRKATISRINSLIWTFNSKVRVKQVHTFYSFIMGYEGFSSLSLCLWLAISSAEQTAWALGCCPLSLLKILPYGRAQYGKGPSTAIYGANETHANQNWSLNY